MSLVTIQKLEEGKTRPTVKEAPGCCLADYLRLGWKKRSYEEEVAAPSHPAPLAVPGSVPGAKAAAKADKAAKADNPDDKKTALDS